MRMDVEVRVYIVPCGEVSPAHEILTPLMRRMLLHSGSRMRRFAGSTCNGEQVSCAGDDDVVQPPEKFLESGEPLILDLQVPNWIPTHVCCDYSSQSLPHRA